MSKFIIQDWMGNVLNFKSKFQTPEFSVPLEFNTFEEGWDFIHQNFEEEYFEDLFVVGGEDEK